MRLLRSELTLRVRLIIRRETARLETNAPKSIKRRVTGHRIRRACTLPLVSDMSESAILGWPRARYSPVTGIRPFLDPVCDAFACCRRPAHAGEAVLDVFMWRSADLGAGLGIPASVGLAGGVLAGLGWRYTVLRESVDANPPPLPPGISGYFTRLNYYEYVGGPSWWPTVMLAVIGLMLGLAAGLTRIAITRDTYPPAQSALVGNIVAMGVAGGLTGLCGAVIAHWAPPSIRVVNAAGPKPQDYNEGAGFSDVAGAPPFWDISPTFVWFPWIGVLFGVAATTALLIGIRTRHIWSGVDDDVSTKSPLRVPIDTLPWIFVVLSPIVALGLIQLGDAMSEQTVYCDSRYSTATGISTATVGSTEDVQAQNALIAGSLVMIAIGVTTLLVVIWKRRTMGRLWRRRLTVVSLAVVAALIGFGSLIKLAEFSIKLSCV